ncbi:hypothetical protein ACRDNQ_11180 [Palleronia sp. KMU-117]|uniref:hypothetical protein n=1 Tax=Palleronia sp. KMU-117 TaxID=3434108 RepID=UPI003D7210DE
MSGRAAFSDEDWSAVLQAPILAGLAITAAEPGGLLGALSESAAMARTLKSAAAAAAEGDLVAEVARSFEVPAEREAASAAVKALAEGLAPADLVTASVARLAAIMRRIEAATPAQADAYRGFLLDLARATAEASREGGVLGIGGVRVSEAEQRTLDDLAAALAAPSA